MLLATFMFAGMHTAIRYSTQRLPPVEVAFFRNVFGLVVIAPLLMRHGSSLFYTKRLALHVVRAVLNVVSMLAFFVGLSMTPLAGHRTLVYGSAVYRAAERAVPGRGVPLATLDGHLCRLLRRARDLAARLADL